MKITVLGMDPSLRNWGLAQAELDLTTGELGNPRLDLVQPIIGKTKQVRQNSKDMDAAEQLAAIAKGSARESKVIFVEVPVGSKSARAMASYGICVGILGCMRAEGIQLIEVTATEVKLALTSDKNATKRQMIQAAYTLYPNANWPRHKGEIPDKAEHLADAIGAIHGGVRTPTFQNLMRLFKGAKEPTPQ